MFFETTVSYVNPMQLPLLCINSRAIVLAEPGLTAGLLAGPLAVRRNAGKFQFSKFIVEQIFNIFAAFNTVTALLE